MKKYLIIILLFVAVKLFPQQIDTTKYVPPMQNTNLQANSFKNSIKADKYNKLKNAGIGIAGIGAVAFIAGVFFLAEGISDEASYLQTNSNGTTTSVTNTANNNSTVPSYVTEISGGSLLTTLGVAAIAGGTTMAIIGNAKYKKWSKNRVSVVVAPNAFRIAYKF